MSTTNRIQTAIDAVQTTIPLASVCDFNQEGVVLIETELIRYVFASDKSLVNCQRGFAGTVAVAHTVANGLVTHVRDIDINPEPEVVAEVTSPITIPPEDLASHFVSVSTVSTDNLDLILPRPTVVAPGHRVMISHRIAGVRATGTITFSGLLANDTITIGTPSQPSILGAADSAAVLASSTITNTGATTLNGDLILSPGSSVTGAPTVTGTSHIDDPKSVQAQIDMNTAYNSLAARPFDVDLTGQNLGGMTLTPGVYKFSTSAQLTGTLTLNAQGNPNAIFIFQIGSTLTTAASADVDLINSAAAGNVFWLVGTSATLGTSTDFAGNILAQASITLTTSATILGRALAHTGAVTLDTNVITTSPVTAGVVGNGQVFTAVVSPVGPNQFALGANDTAAAANAVVAINNALSNLVTATSVGPVITITAVLPGLAGNIIALASSNNTRAAVVPMSGGTSTAGSLLINLIGIPSGTAREFIWDGHFWITA